MAYPTKYCATGYVELYSTDENRNKAMLEDVTWHTRRALLDGVEQALWNGEIHTIKLTETVDREVRHYLPVAEVTCIAEICPVEKHVLIMYEVPDVPLAPYITLADKKKHCIYCGAEYIVDSYGGCHSCGGPQGRMQQC